jgi:hypothetical protein
MSLTEQQYQQSLREHLLIEQLRNNILLSPKKEELNCYLYELEFLNKIENCEFWLKAHVIKCINHYSE